MKHLISVAFAILFTSIVGSSAALAMERIGSFVIFGPVPDVIMFDGVIDGDTPADFRRALKARPDARIVIREAREDGSTARWRSPGKFGVAASTPQSRTISSAIRRAPMCSSPAASMLREGRSECTRSVRNPAGMQPGRPRTGARFARRFRAMAFRTRSSLVWTKRPRAPCTYSLVRKWPRCPSTRATGRHRAPPRSPRNRPLMLARWRRWRQ